MDIQKLSMLLKYGRTYGQQHYAASALNDTERSICIYLYFHQDVNQDAIAQGLGLDKTTIAKALTKLAQKEYILRRTNPDNRRENLIHLTEQCQEPLANVVTIQDDWIQKVTSCLTPAENAEFDRLCDLLLESARNALE